MYIHRDDLKKMVEIMDKFPNIETFLIEQDNSSGIGSITYMTIRTTIEGEEGEFKIEVSGVQDW